MTGAVADAEALTVIEICQHMVQNRLQVTCALVRTELEATSEDVFTLRKQFSNHWHLALAIVSSTPQILSGSLETCARRFAQ